MDRVMQEYWQSNLEASGSFLDGSTSYGILRHLGKEYKYDYEQMTRFYKKQDYSEIRPNKMNFAIIRNSMEMRYLFEVLIFCIIAILFQFNVNLYNESYRDTLRVSYIAIDQGELMTLALARSMDPLSLEGEKLYE